GRLDAGQFAGRRGVDVERGVRVLLEVRGGHVRRDLALHGAAHDRRLVLARGDDRDLPRLHDGGHAHGDRLPRHVLLAEEIRRRVLARHRVQRHEAGARLPPRTRLVEADVAGLADPQDLEVDPADGPDRGLVFPAVLLDLLPRDIASWNVDVLRPDVHVFEEVLPHVPAEAVDAIRVHRIVLIQIERHHVAEVEAGLAVHPDEFPIDADGRGSGCEAEDGLLARRGLRPDEGGDPLRDEPSDVFVLLDDDYGNALVVLPHGLSLDLRTGAPAYGCGPGKRYAARGFGKGPHIPGGAGQRPASARRSTATSMMARCTASCTSRRSAACWLFARVGLTRFVRRTTKRLRSGSIQMLVPVKPVWPKDRLEK